MTGSSFKTLNRKDERLEKMVCDYYALCDESYAMYQRLVDPDNESPDYESYYALKARQKRLATSIFCEALNHFRGCWETASEFCKRKEIDW